jgi:hypothetical protein
MNLTSGGMVIDTSAVPLKALLPMNAIVVGREIVERDEQDWKV